MSRFDFKTLKFAGRNRVRTADEIVSEVIQLETTELDKFLKIIKSPTIMGGAEQILTVIASPAALGAALATYIGPLVGIPQAPLVLGITFAPTITGATAAAVVTANMRRTDTPAVIGSQVATMPTGGTNPPGPFIITQVPFGIPAGNGIDVQASASAGAGTLTATATAPIILAALGLT
jgi:hypothetical protein